LSFDSDSKSEIILITRFDLLLLSSQVNARVQMINIFKLINCNNDDVLFTDLISKMDVQNWIAEGSGIVEELKDLVPYVGLSNRLNETLNESIKKVYLNLETGEHSKYTVLLGLYGFKVVANQFDTIEIDLDTQNSSFETVYSLLQSISQDFRHRFNQSLADKLSELQKQRHSFDE
jgi:hypothetical protein